MSRLTRSQRRKQSQISALAQYILSGDCKNVCILVGAGIATASGIPDFRGPEGLYNTLKTQLAQDPGLLTATPAQIKKIMETPIYVFDCDLYRENPVIYNEVRLALILGTFERKWKPTIAHYFPVLLHMKGKLLQVVSMNIDGLLDRVGLPPDKILDVHGNITRVACESCGAEMDFADFVNEVKEKTRNIYDPADGPDKSTPIKCRRCGNATVKPRTVLFGSNLPKEFDPVTKQVMPKADLLFVAGTSLQVYPANTLPGMTSKNAKRVVVNAVDVGEDLGFDYDFLEGKCDEVFLELIIELGWLSDLEEVSRGNLTESSVELIRERKLAEPNA